VEGFGLQEDRQKHLKNQTMSQQEESKLDRILKEVGDINRGLYGDHKNKVKGLMQEHYELKEQVVKLKETDKKRTWVVFGFTSAIGFSAPFVWAMVKKYFGL
jgi:Zn-dependent membrane protease YugP